MKSPGLNSSLSTVLLSAVSLVIASHDGVVYEKDLGPNTLTAFEKMELFNPDKTWSPVKEG
ncbi:MAG: DUF2950 family protein [Blastocatellia bacterium]